jgi:hypothetical protein
VRTYTLVLSFTFVISFADLIYRALSCQHCFNATSDDPFIEEAEDEFVCGCSEEYMPLEVENIKPSSGIPPGSDTEDDNSEEGYVKMDGDDIIEGSNKGDAVGTASIGVYSPPNRRME